MDRSGSEPQRGSRLDSISTGEPRVQAEVASPPRLLRFAAFLLDFMLAFSVTFVVRSLVRSGTLPSLGVWHSGDAGFWVDAQLVFMGFGLACLRDVPFGASFSKWLLCMRLARPDGARLGLRQRLLRAPVSLLPFAWLSEDMQRRMSWRVVTYTPSARGLALRTGLTSAAAAASILWAIETVRPSIGHEDASRLARKLVASDLVLHRELGDPLETRILGITPRAHQSGRGQRATFDLQVRGLLQQQDMVVHARKVDGAWTVEEIDDIAIQATPYAAREAVASR